MTALDTNVIVRYLIQDDPARSKKAKSYIEGRGDFPDYLVKETATRHGCGGVATFDRALLKGACFLSP